MIYNPPFIVPLEPPEGFPDEEQLKEEQEATSEDAGVEDD